MHLRCVFYGVTAICSGLNTDASDFLIYHCMYGCSCKKTVIVLDTIVINFHLNWTEIELGDVRVVFFVFNSCCSRLMLTHYTI